MAESKYRRVDRDRWFRVGNLAHTCPAGKLPNEVGIDEDVAVEVDQFDPGQPGRRWKEADGAEHHIDDEKAAIAERRRQINTGEIVERVDDLVRRLEALETAANIGEQQK